MNLNSTHRRQLSLALHRWKDTPYVAGQCISGPEGGVDCIRYCDSILQETLDLELEPLPRHAQDIALHDREVVQAVTRLFFERFDLISLDLDTKVLPTDLVVVRQNVKDQSPQRPGQHHVLISGPKINVLHDAWPGIGVRDIGLGGVRASFTLLKIYRSRLCYA